MQEPREEFEEKICGSIAICFVARKTAASSLNLTLNGFVCLYDLDELHCESSVRLNEPQSIFMRLIKSYSHFHVETS